MAMSFHWAAVQRIPHDTMPPFYGTFWPVPVLDFTGYDA